jgi:hypothetical protein
MDVLSGDRGRVNQMVRKFSIAIWAIEPQPIELNLMGDRPTHLEPPLIDFGFIR